MASPFTRHGDSRLKAKVARANLANMLAMTTDARLGGFTVEGLAQGYRVRPNEIARMLDSERARRASNGLIV